MQQRRSVRQWIAGILKLQPQVDAMERKAIADANFETGFILGIVHESHKPANASYRDYAHALSEQASGAYARLLAPRPDEIVQPPQSAVYVPPEKQTGPIKQVNPELAKWGIYTESMPAMPGGWMRLRKQNGTLPKKP